MFDFTNYSNLDAFYMIDYDAWGSLTSTTYFDGTPVATRPLYGQPRTSQGNFSLFYTHDGNKRISRGQSPSGFDAGTEGERERSPSASVCGFNLRGLMSPPGTVPVWASC